jgi:hypothetical protein
MGSTSGQRLIEMYTPEGTCVQSLPPPPSGYNNFGGAIAMALKAQVLVCGGYSNSNCYLFDIASNSWSVYSTGRNVHTYFNGVAHDRKIFLYDDLSPEVFDPATKVWSTWKPTPTATYYSCFVSWKGFILRFGGSSTSSSVLQESITLISVSAGKYSNKF